MFSFGVCRSCNFYFCQAQYPFNFFIWKEEENFDIVLWKYHLCYVPIGKVGLGIPPWNYKELIGVYNDFESSSLKDFSWDVILLKYLQLVLNYLSCPCTQIQKGVS